MSTFAKQTNHSVYLRSCFSISSAWILTIRRLDKALIRTKSFCMVIVGSSWVELPHIIQTFSEIDEQFGEKVKVAGSDWSCKRFGGDGDPIAVNSWRTEENRPSWIDEEANVYLLNCSMPSSHHGHDLDRRWYSHVNVNEQDLTRFRNWDCIHWISK